MSSQFIHVECYARRASTKQPNSKNGQEAKARKVKLTAREIADEAERKPEASPHVKEPLEPKLVFGSRPSDVVAEAERRAEASTDSKGRKVREDTAILLAGVASHPLSPDEVEADPTKRAEYERWRKLTIEHLQRKFGDDLKSVVEHTDEGHMHLHFMAVPKAGKGFNAKKLHDGFAAAEGLKGKEQRRVYTDAMRKMQDAYFREVGARCGLARTGPKRERLTRAEWNQRKHEVQAVASVFKEAEADRAEAKVALARARKMADAIILKARAGAESIGMKLTSMFDGLMGRPNAKVRQLEAKAERERREKDKAKKAEADAKKQAEEWQQKVVHERLKNDSTVNNLVALKTLPLEKRVKVLEARNADLTSQLDAVTAENSGMKQQLGKKGPPGMAGPSMGGGPKGGAGR
jgi:hypothetical protein